MNDEISKVDKQAKEKQDKIDGNEKDENIDKNKFEEEIAENQEENTNTSKSTKKIDIHI